MALHKSSQEVQHEGAFIWLVLEQAAMESKAGQEHAGEKVFQQLLSMCSLACKEALMGLALPKVRRSLSVRWHLIRRSLTEGPLRLRLAAAPFCRSPSACAGNN